MKLFKKRKPDGANPEPAPGGKSPYAEGFGKAAQLGVAMLANIFVGFVIGMALDKIFGTAPWLLLLFCLFGVLAGFRTMYRIAMGQYDQ